MNAFNPGPSFGEKIGSALAEALGATVEQKIQLNEAARKRKAEASIGQRMQPLDLLGGIEQKPAVREAQGFPEIQAQKMQPQETGPSIERAPTSPLDPLEQDPLIRQQSISKSRLLTPAEKQQSIQKLMAAGLSPEQAEARVANFDVRAQKYKDYQGQVGEQAKQIFGRYFQTLDPDLERLVENEAERLAVRDANESEVNSYMNQKAKQIKNLLYGVEKGVTPIGANFSLLNDDKQRSTLNRYQQKVKPLTKLGLLDVARKSLAKSGLEPEDIERVVGPLSNDAVKAVKSLKKTAQGVTGYDTPKRYDEIKNTIKNVLEKQPNANLVALRHELVNRGVDWRDYNKLLTDLVDEGVQLSPDQLQQRDIQLDNPPIGQLWKALKGLKVLFKRELPR
jgi:uncharacterized protein YoaH (UPF0181 family)